MGSLEDMREGAALDGTMRGDGDFQDFVLGMFLQADMAAPLADDHKPSSLEGMDDLKVGEAGNDAQSVISANCWAGFRTSSSSTGSR